MKIKFWMKFFLILLILFSLFILGFQIFLKLKGKEVLSRKLTELFGRPVRIEKLEPLFPLGIFLEDLEAEKLFKIKRVYAKGFAIDIFKKGLILFSLKIVEPQVRIERDFFIESPPIKKSGVSLPLHTDLEKKTLAAGVESTTQRKHFFLPFKIKHLVIEKGEFEFIDKIDPQDTVTLRLENLDSRMNNLSFSKRGLGKFSLYLKGELPWNKETIGSLNLEGWIDYLKRNMDLKLALKNVDYFALSSYYPPFWKPANLGLKEAYLSLEAKLNSKNNDLIIDAELSLEKISFLEDFAEPSKIKYLRTVIALIKGGQEKPTLRFRLHTRMDNPRFDFQQITYNLKDTFKVSPILMAESTLDKTKNKLKEATKEIKKLTVDSFLEILKTVVVPLEKKSLSKNETTALEAQENLSEVNAQ